MTLQISCRGAFMLRPLWGPGSFAGPGEGLGGWRHADPTLAPSTR